MSNTFRLHTAAQFALAIACAYLLAACGRAASGSGGPPAKASTAPSAPASFYADDFSKVPTVPEMARLGRVLFFDPRLSRSGTLACATCHDPAFAYGPAPAGRAPPSGSMSGVITDRAIPSLRY